MATVSVVTLAALTAYIVAGLLALARVPDAGRPARRLVQLALWPAAALRTAASPAHRKATGTPTQATPTQATPTETAPLETAPTETAPTAVAQHSMEPAPLVAAAGAREPGQDTVLAPASAPAAPASPAPDAAPEPPPRDARGEWERFVLRLTELSD